MIIIARGCPSLLRSYAPLAYRIRQLTQTSLVETEQAPRSSLFSIDIEAWTGAEKMAARLHERIVAMSEDFIVLDKPAGLSVWGHSTSQLECLQFMQQESPFDRARLCIHDCLPILARLLPVGSESPPNVTGLVYDGVGGKVAHRHNNDGDESGRQRSLPKLIIVDPLPAAYSGLLLLARTEEFAKYARQFYATAATNRPLWQLYQRFLAVCANTPTRQSADNVTFPIASFPVNEHVRIGYRPAPSDVTSRLKRDGSILRKHVSHRTIQCGLDHTSLVQLDLNSTFRGLPEVYLLHEGCSIVGERVHASRLLRPQEKSAPIILPPSQGRFDSNPIAPHLNRHLSDSTRMPTSDASSSIFIPIHLHRTRLLLPTPIYSGHVTKSGPLFRSIISAPPSPNVPLGVHINPPANDVSTLSWVSLNETENEETNVAKERFVLACSAPTVPLYFSDTLSRLGMHFDKLEAFKEIK